MKKEKKKANLFGKMEKKFLNGGYTKNKTIECYCCIGGDLMFKNLFNIFSGGLVAILLMFDTVVSIGNSIIIGWLVIIGLTVLDISRRVN